MSKSKTSDIFRPMANELTEGNTNTLATQMNLFFQSITATYTPLDHKKYSRINSSIPA